MNKKHIPYITLCFIMHLVSAAGAFDSGDLGPVDIHGFISQGYIHTTNNNWMGASEDGTWQFNELGLNFTSMLANRLRLGMQFFARDLGVLGNDEISIDFAYADYNFRDWFGIRVGQMKNPLGMFG